jgi:hypothetical protein
MNIDKYTYMCKSTNLKYRKKSAVYGYCEGRHRNERIAADMAGVDIFLGIF